MQQKGPAFGLGSTASCVEEIDKAETPWGCIQPLGVMWGLPPASDEAGSLTGWDTRTYVLWSFHDPFTATQQVAMFIYEQRLICKHRFMLSRDF